MKVPLGMSSSVSGPLMEPHRVGERNAEEVVVSCSDAAQHFSQRVTLILTQLFYVGAVLTREKYRFKRPHRPKRNEQHEALVLRDDTRPVCQLQPQVVTKQT